MGTKKATIKTCDVCHTKVDDGGETWFGGHPFEGWFTVHQHSGSTALSKLNQVRDWDICSKACLIKLGKLVSSN